MYNKTIIEFGFRLISWIIKTSCLYYLPKPKASADNTDLGFDNSWYHAQPHPIIVHYQLLAETMSDVSNNLVPTNIQELFLPLSRVHSYSTRSSTSQNFYRKISNLEIKITLSQDLVRDTDQVAYTFKTQTQI